MPAPSSLTRTPFFFLGRRPYRETQLAAYLRREHRRGRHLTDIVTDPYVERCGGQSVLRAVLRSPQLIRALGDDVDEAIQDAGLTVGPTAGRSTDFPAPPVEA